MTKDRVSAICRARISRSSCSGRPLEGATVSLADAKQVKFVTRPGGVQGLVVAYAVPRPGCGR